MAIEFKKAVKYDAKLRLALCGPAGSGKTFTALTVATVLGGPIAYIDTEHGSASKYADLFEFDVIEPDTFDPRDLCEMIDQAVAGGYRVVVIDSLSHYWTGKGGELELVDIAGAKAKGNSFAGWKTVTPFHNQLIDKIIGAKIHVIAGIRTKTEWVIEKNDRGQSVPRKVGLAPIMRDGIEFEFDVCGDLDQDNSLTITKTRCPTLAGKIINRPGKDMALVLKAWCAGSVSAPTPAANAAPAPTAKTDTTVSPQQDLIIPDPEVAPALLEIYKVLAGGDKFAKLKPFQDLKAGLRQVLGDEGEMRYYDILARNGVEKSDQFKSLGAAKQCATALYNEIQHLISAVVDKGKQPYVATDDDVSFVPAPETVHA